MPYIYKITNQINQKIYIGKTNRNIKIRFKEHCRNVNKNSCEKRPLYIAMRKYGIENFFIELIEECSLNEVEEREKYWIEFYRSFKNGYNATIGGDGKSYIDREIVIKNYKELGEIKSVAKIMNISEDSVHNILLENNIKIKQTSQINKEKMGIPVSMYSLNNELLKTFSSYGEAAKWLVDNNLTNCKIDTIRTHISAVCNGKRKSAAGYIWKK